MGHPAAIRIQLALTSLLLACLHKPYFVFTASHGVLYTDTLTLGGAIGTSLGPFQSSCNLHFAVASLQYPVRIAVAREGSKVAEQLTDSPAARQTHGVMAIQASGTYVLVITGTARIDQDEEFQVAVKVTGGHPAAFSRKPYRSSFFCTIQLVASVSISTLNHCALQSRLLEAVLFFSWFWVAGVHLNAPSSRHPCLWLFSTTCLSPSSCCVHSAATHKGGSWEDGTVLPTHQCVHLFHCLAAGVFL